MTRLYSYKKRPKWAFFVYYLHKTLVAINKIENFRYTIINEDDLAKNYPNAYKYLLDNKEELLRRDIDKRFLWYEFGSSQGIQTMHNKKIVIGTLIKDIIKYYEIDEDTLNIIIEIYDNEEIVISKPILGV